MAHDAIAGLIDGRIGRSALEPYDIDADVVVVVNRVVGDAEIRNVAIYYQRLARPGFQMMYFVAVDDQVGNRSFGIRAIDSDSKSIAAAPRLIATWEGLLNIVNIIFQ